ncbi:bifunctional 3,4-dihydroxy-2-butanone-4-phosphate synthase/GTP cyclohydrolase II, partial [Beggiatoa alba]|nr:bifunctional 3,4-dihydroxy-2-butanone-4-phosphate synthase/GTP cyclohydrolase II [Beggiatoa alba]
GQVKRYSIEDSGEELNSTENKDDLRTFGIGAQILSELGVRHMRVLSAPKKMHALSGFGLDVVEYVHD